MTHGSIGGRQLVIGLGSGRSGTTSLTNLLNAQKNSFVVHEGGYIYPKTFRQAAPIAGDFLPWEVSLEKLDQWHQGLVEASEGSRVYGDVSSSFLPYVPAILERWPQVKFVCIKRAREAVVKSFMHVTPGSNLWNKDSSIAGVPDFWSDMYPDMGIEDKEEAIGAYWDMYYTEAERYERMYPASFKVFDIDQLNTVDGKKKILEHVGFPAEDMQTAVVVHANKRYFRPLTWFLRALFSLLTNVKRLVSWAR